MAERRWTNNTQPQTLQIAVILLYVVAGETLIFGDPFAVQVAFHTSYRLIQLLIVTGGVAGGLGIANEKRWGYVVGTAVAILPLVARAYVCFKAQVSPLSFDLAGLLFEVALVALLLHPGAEAGRGVAAPAGAGAALGGPAASPAEGARRGGRAHDHQGYRAPGSCTANAPS